MTNLRENHINTSTLIIFEAFLHALGTEQLTFFRIPWMERHIMRGAFLPYENLRRPSHNYLFCLFILVLHLIIIWILFNFFFVLFSLLIIIPLLLLINSIKFHLNLAGSVYLFEIWLSIRIFLLYLNHYTCSE